jgi:acetylglutamate kinase
MNMGQARAALTVPAALQARVLHEALPYVQSVQGKTFVVECDGQWLGDPALRAGLGRDVALLHLVGLRLVLVHGGLQGGSADRSLELLRTHRDLVGSINQQGCRAVGLTPDDGGASGLAGGLVQRLQLRDFIPVVTPRAGTVADGRARIDADALAGRLAQDLGAEKLLMLGDSPGLRDNAGRLVAVLSARDAAAWRNDSRVPAATQARLGVALEAVAHGVRSAHLIDGRQDHALLLEVLSNAGEGTMVLPERAPNFLADSLSYLRRS